MVDYTRLEKLHIFLDLFEGLDYDKKAKLIALYKDPLDILANFFKDENIKNILGNLYGKIKICFNSEFISRAIDGYEKSGIKIVTVDSKAYPEKLKRLYKPPFILYCKGDVSLLNSRCISIVGSRNISNKAKEVTEFFSAELARHNLTVVSGMARGADTAAHKGALKVNGKTIAVLAGGFNDIYPKENYGLYENICKQGLVITENCPPIPNLPHMFLIRNRIVAGLSEGVLVTYANIASGTQSTVEYAIDAGSELFVLPGEVNSKESQGSNIMLKATSGALITEPKDILKALNIEFLPQEKIETEVEEQEKFILNILELDEIHFSDIIEKSKLQVQELNALLLKMEIKGLIRKLTGNYFKAI